MGAAHDLALQAALAAGVRVRPIQTLEEADHVVRLQTGTWGEGQVIPREAIRALQGAGAPPLGAFAGSAPAGMVGFVLGFLGTGADGVHLHSHMLAVDSAHQTAGVGRALKLAQRAWALDEGLDTIRWTFDPLIARNAHFNLQVLGVVADRFHRHYYGDMTDDINRGERTDRLEARWDLDRDPGPRPGAHAVATVEVPPDHTALRRSDPAAAREWRERVSSALEANLGEGLIVTGFDRTTFSYRLSPA